MRLLRCLVGLGWMIEGLPKYIINRFKEILIIKNCFTETYPRSDNHWVSGYCGVV